MKNFKEYLKENTEIQEASCDCDCGKSPCETCGKDHHNESVTEAVGDPAAPLYDLIDEVGSHQLVLDELVRFLDVDQIEEFVADFRRHHDMNQTEEQFEVTPEEVDILKKLAGL
jgi:hypothetical protein